MDRAEATWEYWTTLQQKFPTLNFEDEDLFSGRAIDTVKKAAEGNKEIEEEKQ